MNSINQPQTGMQLYDTEGRRLYFTEDERRAFVRSEARALTTPDAFEQAEATDDPAARASLLTVSITRISVLTGRMGRLCGCRCRSAARW